MPASNRNELLRQRIKTLIQASRGDGYSTVSALLGRNPSYMHQYITRGSPKCLREEDRRIIARYFGISPRHLLLSDAEDDSGFSPQNSEQRQSRQHSTNPTAPDENIVMIDLWPTQGRRTDSQDIHGLPFLRSWLNFNFPSIPALIAVMIVGDAMAPSLVNGSIALVDRTQTLAQRDGIYILLAGGEAIPRRISLNPLTGHVTVAADNRLYPGQNDCDPHSLSILGRVVWIGQCV